MANERHLELIRRGAGAWNEWRREAPAITPDLSGASLAGAALAGVDFAFTNLFAADLSGAALDSVDFNSANLMYADLTAADLEGADFRQANLFAADLSRARLGNSRFSGAHASGVKLQGAVLAGANLFVADISRADLSGADLRRANFFGSRLNNSNLSGADCRDADLSGADLAGALLAGVDFTGATLSDCKIKGVTAADLELAGAIQNDLVLTASNEPEIAVDGFPAAMAVAAIINGTVTSPEGRLPGGDAILLMGAYPHERKGFLNAIREEVRKAGFVPLLFGLENAGSDDYSALVSRLAERCRLTLVDLGSLVTLPRELPPLITTTAAPVQPILAGAASGGVNGELAALADTTRLGELFQTDTAALMIAALGTIISRMADHG